MGNFSLTVKFIVYINSNKLSILSGSIRKRSSKWINLRTATVMFECKSLSDQQTGGLGFKPWLEKHSGSLNEREEIAAFVVTSAIDFKLNTKSMARSPQCRGLAFLSAMWSTWCNFKFLNADYLSTHSRY